MKRVRGSYAAIVKQERAAREIMEHLAKFFEAAQALGDSVYPSKATQTVCQRLMALAPAGPAPDAAAAQRAPSPKRPSSQQPKRASGSRAPAGTLTKLLQGALDSNPGQVLAVRELATWMTERGWVEPMRPGHAIHRALVKLAAKEGSGISRVGRASWRYDPQSAPTSAAALPAFAMPEPPRSPSYFEAASMRQFVGTAEVERDGTTVVFPFVPATV